MGRAAVGERELAPAMVRYAFGAYGVHEDMAAVAADLLQLPDPHTGRRSSAAGPALLGAGLDTRTGLPFFVDTPEPGRTRCSTGPARAAPPPWP